MIGFLSDAIIGTVAEVQIIRVSSPSPEGHMEQCQTFLKGSVVLRALNLLTDYPIPTADCFGHLLDITSPTTQTALTQLCHVRILDRTHRQCPQ